MYLTAEWILPARIKLLACKSPLLINERNYLFILCISISLPHQIIRAIFRPFYLIKEQRSVLFNLIPIWYINYKSILANKTDIFLHTPSERIIRTSSLSKQFFKQTNFHSKKTIEMKCILGGGETHGLTQKWAFRQTADLKKTLHF